MSYLPCQILKVLFGVFRLLHVQYGLHELEQYFVLFYFGWFSRVIEMKLGRVVWYFCLGGFLVTAVLLFYFQSM